MPSRAKGPLLHGTVKSYIPQKGWGFLWSSHMPEKDIFFAKRDVQPKDLGEQELKGMFVSFILVTEDDGKVQAKEVMFEDAHSLFKDA